MPDTDTDDEREMERIASNNPAMTMPASQIISSREMNRLRSRSRSQTKVLSSSDPAGDSETFIKAPQTPESTPSKYEVGWRRVVRNFSPSWFSVTMGTGIVSLLLITIPFKADWLYWLSVAFFVLNTILFTFAFGISVVRYTLYPEIWAVMIADPTNSLFLGTIPMGFATLVESWIFLCCPYWGYWSVTFAWVCWMIDAVVSAAVTVSLPFLLISQSHQHQLDRITAAQLLPIAATIVAAGAGSEVAELLDNPNHALGTLITSYVMWGMATPFAMTILVIYYHRLALYKLPPREVVVSSFLPLGPLGMGGYTIMYLGRVSREVFPRAQIFHDLPPTLAGDVLYVFGVFVALIMWGFGLVWLIFALATIYSTRPFPFNMGWWGFTFPLGVYAISTMTFGVEMPSMFFKVLGTILSVAVMILWCVVAAGTAKGAWSGHLFSAPCLKNLPKPHQRPEVVEGDVDKEKSSGS
ncbi:Plasma membrane sulfite pump involved in sulfite metabolism [Exophiala xenobiotica]|nr:Plasma membrane sulfite pump involved in sulfite metabolism [Exophiala xenobiotica]